MPSRSERGIQFNSPMVHLKIAHTAGMQINSSTYQHMCRNPHLGQENLLVDFQVQYLVRNNGFD